MITFTLCLLALIAGYFIYGRFIERVFGPDDRKTPALTKADGVDYIPLPTWKIFMIQFLNIAGLGPIFGAIMGAKFGTASYLWIGVDQRMCGRNLYVYSEGKGDGYLYVWAFSYKRKLSERACGYVSYLCDGS